ncbi:GNAT family N-acetyltransferase [Actinomadura sp. 7K534]|uniref:GNAT family N-acetyltransferase n=1 Tax=Actinomadura sp. 7K534 TaxID=2530366 RepID=UPI0010521B81|nr:GNAT family N-acetyltransferase [Actinomadura sp. 7K534]TDB95841.1 GNAT family N-acetyltransferase [Actinomadura sp. 7K534]
MEWTLSYDLDEFMAAAGGFLHDDPARNTVALTVTGDMRAEGPEVRKDVLFGWWPGGEHVEGAFLWTPSYPPLLSAMPERAARNLADVLAEREAALPGVSGSQAATEAFADEWKRRTGAASRVTMHQRLYRLGELEVPDPLPAGTARTANRDERPLMLEWATAFWTEVDEHGPVNTAMMDARLETGRIALWEAGGQPVAMAWWSPVAAGMSRVSAVYTPPEHRRRGYGAAVTTKATRSAMEEGATDVVLFTDLANPTSNAVYHRLGYRPVEDRMVLAFT